MNKIYIYGAGKNGEYVRNRIINCYSESIEIIGFIDSVKKGSYLGVPITRLCDVDDVSDIVIAVNNLNDVVDIYLNLRKAGKKNIYWCCSYGINGIKRIDFLKDECIFTGEWGGDVLPHLEYHISDMCNLNCKGCTHFSPLFHELGDSFEIRISELEKLLKKVSHVVRLDILGGEPLLNPELGKYIKEIRAMLPNTCIHVFTNGLLIPKLNQEICQCIKENNIYISISEYKPTHGMIEQIIDKLEEYQISYHISQYDVKQIFNRPISLSEHSKYPQHCISDGCITIGNGSIARCPTLLYITRFNEVFHTQLPTEGILNLDDSISGQKLLDRLREEVPLCKHCIKCDMEWDTCKGRECMEDFAVID